MKKKSIKTNNSKERVGIIGIFVNNNDCVQEVNSILGDFYQHFRGRLGIPKVNENSHISAISLIFVGNTDDMGALTGRLGQLKGVEVKTLLSKEETE